MKKLLTLLVLLVTSIGAMAHLYGPWTNPHTNQPGTFTTIYAKLQITPPANSAILAPYHGYYTIAAFVGVVGEEECRLVTLDNVNTSTIDGTTILTLSVPGNYDNEDDAGKPIYFLLKDNSGLIYQLESSEFITFLGKGEDAYGTPPSTSAIVLSMKMPTNYELPQFEVNVGESVKLSDLLVVTPADATKPMLEYSIDPEYTEYASISGDTLTGLKPVTGALVIIGNGESETEFNVVQHATGVSIVTSTYQVEIDDHDALTDFMQNKLTSKAYSLTPADATDFPSWEFEDESFFNESDGWKPIKAGTTRIRPYLIIGGQKVYPANPEWITVEIVVPVTNAYLNWQADEADDNIVNCNVGDDIYSRIASCVKIEPAEAAQTFTITIGDDVDSQYFTFAENSIKVIKAPISASPVALLVTPTGINGSEHEFYVWVSIDNWATTLAKVQDALAFTTETAAATVQQAIVDNVTYGPTGTGPNIKFTSPGPWLDLTLKTTSDAGRGDLSLEDGDLPLSMEAGEHTVTATLTYPDYSNYYGKASDITNATKTVTFTVTISTGLQYFNIVVTPSETDMTTGTIALTPQPEGASFDINDFSINFEMPASYAEWNWDGLSTSPSTSSLSYTYSAALPGQYGVSITKIGDNDHTDYGSTEFEVPAVITFNNGWQWCSNPYGSVAGNKLKEFLTNNLLEGRTYSKLLINDPSWGFFGTLTSSGIGMQEMYKVKMDGNQTCLYYLPDAAANIEGESAWSLQPGWNWVGSPYLFKRSLSEAIPSANRDLVNKMVIVSKANGSAEWNGSSWVGTLKSLKAGEGYLVYNPTNAEKSLVLPSEAGMGMGDDNVAGARNRASSVKVWHYDHTQFANNMTMVVSMPDLQDADDYTIGAFVNGECRGEGVFEDGLGFITVHTDGGEQVTFRLYNKWTNEYFDIDQTVTSQTRVGSLSSPMTMTSHQLVTGISEVRQENAGNSERYDLSGRKVDGVSKGVSLKRMADGTFRKVMK